MIMHVKAPTAIKAQGNEPKLIEEFIGRMNTETQGVSIARMKSPAGWIEPGQKPEFDEYTVVLQGLLRVKTSNETIDVKTGESIIVGKDEWVQYSTPAEQGAECVLCRQCVAACPYGACDMGLGFDLSR